jgi:hypothetical protein
MWHESDIEEIAEFLDDHGCGSWGDQVKALLREYEKPSAVLPAYRALLDEAHKILTAVGALEPSAPIGAKLGMQASDLAERIADENGNPATGESPVAENLRGRLDRIAEAHQRCIDTSGANSGDCQECGWTWPCPTQIWATDPRNPLVDCWHPSDDDKDSQ